MGFYAFRDKAPPPPPGKKLGKIDARESGPLRSGSSFQFRLASGHPDHPAFRARFLLSPRNPLMAGDCVILPVGNPGGSISVSEWAAPACGGRLSLEELRWNPIRFPAGKLPYPRSRLFPCRPL